MTTSDVFQFSVAAEDAGMRLDLYITQHLPDVTRSHIAQLIRRGCVLIDGAASKPGHKVQVQEHISVQIPEAEPTALRPEPIPLDVLFEDDHLLVVNKQAGLVVHPAAGHASGTLVNGILYHCRGLDGIGGELRPGIVHRLDKETSGVMVVAKTSTALHQLAGQFKQRTIRKRYLALVYGSPDRDSGVVDLPIGRHPVDRKKMSTTSHSARRAVTHWQVKERLDPAALLSVDLETGRTHQIRVHCKAMGHPIIGDPVYGYRRGAARWADRHPLFYKAATLARRQMLHAHQLGLVHPESGRFLTFEAPPAEDFSRILEELRRIRSTE